MVSNWYTILYTNFYFLFTKNELIILLFIDVGTYLSSIIVSIYWFNFYDDDKIKEIGAVTNLLFYLKFLLFFRVIQSFGIYFSIIIGVAKKVFPFLVVLFFILLGFAHAFFIVLRTLSFSLDKPVFNDDPNNPWNLANRYIFIDQNGAQLDDRILI